MHDIFNVTTRSLLARISVYLAGSRRYIIAILLTEIVHIRAVQLCRLQCLLLPRDDCKILYYL